MKIDPDDFRVRPGAKVRLKRWPTRGKPYYRSKSDYAKRLAKAKEDLERLQGLLYATDRHALLLVFQAMDAAGKDSAIRHVMTGVNPQGCEVYSFKHPSAEELDHDFLWRYAKSLPRRGRIGIFNRSHYEEVLIVRVHPAILRAQKIPGENLDEATIWAERYRSIVDFEGHLVRSGTRVLKFFLHLSKEEQRRRFIERIDEPEKNWKFSAQDVEERRYWNDYMKAYEQCLSATSMARSPWFIVPADDKRNARLIVSAIVVRALRELGMQYPKPDRERREELLAIREQLAKGDA